MTFTRELPNDGNREEIKEFLVKHWGSSEIVSKGKITDATKLPRIVAKDSDGRLVDLLTYLMDKTTKSCEIITIDSEVQGQGIGTKLISMLEDVAKEEGCERIWLITTNDNPEASTFYVKKGYRLVAVHLNALDASRKLKPQIPKTGKHGIPLLDEWEFEKVLN